MSMDIPITLKTGFFQSEPAIMKIDNRNRQILFVCEKGNKVFIVDFPQIMKVYYNPLANDELTLQTIQKNYIANIEKQMLGRGIIDFFKIEFGDKFRVVQ